MLSKDVLKMFVHDTVTTAGLDVPKTLCCIENFFSDNGEVF